MSSWHWVEVLAWTESWLQRTLHWGPWGCHLGWRAASASDGDQGIWLLQLAERWRLSWQMGCGYVTGWTSLRLPSGSDWSGLWSQSILQGEKSDTSQATNAGNVSVVKRCFFRECKNIHLVTVTEVKMLFSDIPSLGFCWNSAASEGRKMTSLSCSFHDTRRILQMSCRACSSETSEFVEVSWGAEIETTGRVLSQSRAIYVKSTLLYQELSVYQ